MATEAIPQEVSARRGAAARRARATPLKAHGEPFLWALGGALALGIVMIVGFLAMVFWNGAVTFWPKPIAVVTLADGGKVAGEPTRSEDYRLGQSQLQALPPATREAIRANDGFAHRTLYRSGNYDLYGDDFRWISDFQVVGTEAPKDMVLVERREWGPFVGTIKSIATPTDVLRSTAPSDPAVRRLHEEALARWRAIRHIERDLIGEINHESEKERLALKAAELEAGNGDDALAAARARFDRLGADLKSAYDELAARAAAIRAEDAKYKIALAEIGGREKELTLSTVVRMYAANDLSFWDKAGIYLSRWGEFLSEEPREANTEGGVLPAIFGTAAMTLLMVIFVSPFGIVTALYLREYAKQGRLVSIVRISVNNLAGVPSIVYGVFGLGFFAYIIGYRIDQLFYPEKLPSPTFGTGGLLWASLTLALLTVPVVIVATEEALAAVPRSMREGSLACGASKWQTIRRIVLPRAMPGIMTGIILAMARGAGEVAPLMLVGVVKLAPELPIDGYFPYIHLERSFMHLGFHIYDVGFQSRNSEAGKPMVFVTTMLLIGLIFLMNVTAIYIRNRLKRKFAGSQF
ncbi:MAG TPA: phosphate ABC transporter permease PstA [Alphaproteobacteria bacterium]